MNTKSNDVSFVQANYRSYPETVRNLQRSHSKFPRTVSIETQVKCNAKCGFCPYPESPRQGEEMSDELFYKIINDLSEIPNTHDFRITLCRINEPLLDKRLQRFHEVIAEKLPSAKAQFWSNGTMLREGLFEWMAEHKNATLTISLNAVDEEDHVRLMGIGLKRVFPNLDYVHRLAEAGRFPLTVLLVAPFESEEQAQRVENYCKDRWPLFTPGVRPFFVWVGGDESGKSERETSNAPDEMAVKAVEFSCAQWFDLHVLANGYATRCCIDETGFVGQPKYDMRNRHALDVFAESAALRAELPARSSVSGCEGCRHLG